MPLNKLTDIAIRSAKLREKPVKLFDGGGMYSTRTDLAGGGSSTASLVNTRNSRSASTPPSG